MRYLLLILLVACSSGKVENPYADSKPEDRKKFKIVNLPFGGVTHFFVLRGAYEQRESGTEHTWNLNASHGTPVVAMESGRIIEVVHNLPLEGGCNKKFKGKESYIHVEHIDKTIGIYKHVRPVVVKNQIVTKGQSLGTINISGFVCQPQIEIAIVKHRNLINSKSINRTLPLLFKGIRRGLLLSRRSY